MNVIGDIAGQFKTLEALIKKMPQGEIMSLGDMVDRGPRSKDVLNFFKSHKALLGNHEHLMIDAFEYSQKLHELGASVNNWRAAAKEAKLKAYYQVGLWIDTNGGDATIASYDPYSLKMEGNNILNLDEVIFHLCEIIPQADIDYLKSLPKFYEDDQFFLSHAPKMKRKTPQEVSDLGEGFWVHGNRVSDSSLIWNRKEPNEYAGKIQIFGHNSYESVRAYSSIYPQGIGMDKVIKKKIELNNVYAYGIDTSAAKILTGLHLPTMTWYHQPFID